MGFETDALLRAGHVEFVLVADNAVRYSIQIQARNGCRYVCCWADEDES